MKHFLRGNPTFGLAFLAITKGREESLGMEGDSLQHATKSTAYSSSKQQGKN